MELPAGLFVTAGKRGRLHDFGEDLERREQARVD
jgi:hypothetical protein